MRLAANLELAMQVIEKGNGLFYAQAWDTDTLNLVFDKECRTYLEACSSLANFVMDNLMNGVVP